MKIIPRITNIIRRAALVAVSAMTVLVLLVSCGSELDGTWRSRSDEDTRIRISGDKVRITYDGFRIDGTYETDDDNNITFHLTDENGNKYKIVAKLTYEKKKKTITLTNSKGESEIFEK